MNKPSLRIIFFGSDDFAALHLEHLLKSNHQILCCVTGPDQAQGRGMKIVLPPIKQMALDHQIPCLQPATLKDKAIVEALKEYAADIFVVVAYGRLLTQEILDTPKMLCMNVHGSLLPKYRGAAPVNWAILNGEKITGVTIQKMALALDAGEIISQEVIEIKDDENAAQLRRRMAQVGASLLVKVLDENPSGHFPLIPQDASQVTWASKLTRQMGHINWNSPARSIINQVRGLQPWPGAFTSYHGKTLKVLHAQAIFESIGQFSAGQVMDASKDGIKVACLDQPILLKEVQPEAGKAMTAGSFTAGYMNRGQSPIFI